MKYTFTLFTLFVIALSAGAQSTLPYTQDFEGATFFPMGWERFGSNTNADWQHSTTVGAYDNSTGSAFFDNFSVDLSGNFYGMRAMSLDLTNAVKPTLKFDVAYAQRTGAASDKLGIWYSLNGTTGWDNIQDYEGATLTTAPDQATLFTPTASQWDSITLDLTQFAGESFIRFAFENNSRNGNVIYIDNVRFYDAQFVGIDDNKQLQSNVSVYPNPVSNGRIEIDTKGKKLNQIRVMDQLGKVHAFEANYQSGVYTINTDQLSPGIYSVWMELKGEAPQVKKIVIQ